MRLVDDFSREERRAELQNLSPRHRVAFAAITAERLLPNYAAFSRQSGWGEPGALRKAVDVVWSVAQGFEVPRDRLAQLHATCEALVPDSERFPEALTSAAIDAGNAVCEALECCLDGGAEHAADVASFAYDTVHMHLQEVHDLDYEDPSFDGRILTDPLMQRELQQQEKDLMLLRRNAEVDAELVKQLRASWPEVGRSNIDLG